MSDQDSGDSPPASRWNGGFSTYSAPKPAPGPDAARMKSLYQSALAALFRGRADLARAAVDELARAFPQRPEVQHLMRQAAIIAFEWPAARQSVAPVARAAPAQDTIDLVAFHVQMPLAPSGIHAPIDYMAVLSLSFESARLRAPRARRILLTDEKTPVPDSLPVDRVMRFPLDPERLMFERMRVQELYLRGRAAGRASIMMDSDVVVNADPAGVFAESFDIGLTWRPEFPDAPFNGGMIFVPEGNGGHAFIVKALECYEAFAADASVANLYPKSLKAWWGDQFALALMAGYRAYAERTSDVLAIDGLRARLFPCSEYNFTIEAGTQYPREELRRKRFIHFKGNRKAMQSQYLERMRSGEL
jgi:hypothetical protein